VLYMNSFYTNEPGIKVKLIFNPSAGANSKSPVQLMDIIEEMQAWRLIPEAYLIKPDGDLPGMIKDALDQGIQLFVVCGGDGTISAVARELSGTKATLGIIPTGTQNNVAFSLGIPKEIPAAIALLRTGRRTKVDVGMVACGETVTPFMELCSIGLFSTIFSSIDDIQHGNLLRIGDFLAALVKTPPAEMRLLLDGGQEILTSGHVLLICNMPCVIRHYSIGSEACFQDGYLDILLFSCLTKMDLMEYVVKGPGADMEEDPRIQRYRVRRADIKTEPAMPVMADGRALGEGRVQIEIQDHSLTVMAAHTSPKSAQKSGEKLEKQTVR
jgi:diacylglycerol kinase family enzyme